MLPQKRFTSPLLVSLLALAFPGAASAYFPHTIASGESLYSVAAADGLSVSQLAAANGLSSVSGLRTGATLYIPPRVSSYAGTPSTSSSTGDGDGDGDDVASTTRPAVSTPGTSTGSASTSTVSTASRSTGGAYLVEPGDTLSAIAARAGVSVAELAAINGLDPQGLLLAGHALRLSGGGSSATGTTSSSTASASAATSQPVGSSAQGTSSGGPYPTPERVSSSEVGTIAAAHGVPASLADAIGWQESGFNNDLVSSADARGVMQILPGTWDWIRQSLSVGHPLSSYSAADNVRGGVLLLHSLLSSTGGDPAMAAAGYYQGLPSVRAHGLYRDTQAYVNSVMALSRHFGGG